MKLQRHITILVCLLLLAGGLAVVLLPQVVPPSECSEDYRQYAESDDVDATFIKDYEVNDTTNVDVTLLSANNEEGWKQLMADYQIPMLTKEIEQIFSEEKDIIGSKLLERNGTVEVMAIWYSRQQVCIFHISTAGEREAVLKHNMDCSINQ